MAKYLDFKYTSEDPKEALRQIIEAAPYEHAEALLKAYELLEVAAKHGILDVLKGAISAEDTILTEVAGYASTREGINLVRNTLVLARLLAAVDPEFLHEAGTDMSASVIAEAKRPGVGFFTTTRRMFSGDGLRGLRIALAGLESLGRAACHRATK